MCSESRNEGLFKRVDLFSRQTRLPIISSSDCCGDDRLRVRTKNAYVAMQMMNGEHDERAFGILVFPRETVVIKESY